MRDVEAGSGAKYARQVIVTYHKQQAVLIVGQSGLFAGGEDEGGQHELPRQ
jgi:membrane-bound inhibitor of C-type lysozyme